MLLADEEAQLTAAQLDDAPLEFCGGRCQVPSLKGRLVISFRDGDEDTVPLFQGEPLIFKLPRNWAGQGRRTSQITSGHFIVIAPVDWARTGDAPVEAEGCIDQAFRAHYFHRDAASDDTVGGFQESQGSLVSTGIELEGRASHDDSDHGPLFVGGPPVLKASPDFEWARVGEELDQGWGENFRPCEQTLPEVLDGREGRFFLRVYDRETDMLDSVAFRYVSDLSRIDINGTEYAQDTVLQPEETGYPRTEICLVGADGAARTPVLPPQAVQETATSGAIQVPPHPDADLVTCALGSGSSAVRVVLDLPRIWWRLEDGRPDPGAWRDTPLVLTREEFRERARADATLSVLSRRHPSLRAGFDDRLEQRYRRKTEEDYIRIPLDHFADHSQIDRNLAEEAHLSVERAGVRLPLIRIPADPLPEILSFTSDPPMVKAGQATVLRWAARNAEGVRARIDPAIGSVQPTGSVRVEPAASMHFTLRLKAPGVEAVTRDVAVEVIARPEGRKLMTPMQFLDKVLELQRGTFHEYYRGLLAADTSGEASRLGRAARYWESEGIIELVQDRIRPVNGNGPAAEGCAYFAVRTSKAIAPDCIERARVLGFDRIP